jgi:hypothetical protein
LDIKDKESALRKKSYNCVLALDEYFPEMLQFWSTCFSILKKDFALTNHST